MQFRMFTHNGLKIGVPVAGVRLVEQDAEAPAHSIIHVNLGCGLNQLISVDEDFHTVLSRLDIVVD